MFRCIVLFSTDPSIMYISKDQFIGNDFNIFRLHIEINCKTTDLLQNSFFFFRITIGIMERTKGVSRSDFIVEKNISLFPCWNQRYMKTQKATASSHHTAPIVLFFLLILELKAKSKRLWKNRCTWAGLSAVNMLLAHTKMH